MAARARQFGSRSKGGGNCFWARRFKGPCRCYVGAEHFVHGLLHCGGPPALRAPPPCLAMSPGRLVGTGFNTGEANRPFGTSPCQERCFWQGAECLGGTTAILCSDPGPLASLAGRESSVKGPRSEFQHRCSRPDFRDSPLSGALLPVRSGVLGRMGWLSCALELYSGPPWPRVPRALRVWVSTRGRPF